MSGCTKAQWLQRFCMGKKPNVAEVKYALFMEMECLRSMYGVTELVRVINEDVVCKVGVRESLSE